MIDKAINKDGQGHITDTLDIVCHSMGFACALGMIDVMKGQIPFGRFYIIAPEDASAGSVPAGFTQVWQYGSNEKTDPLDKQDGVAPQTKCGGLNDNQRAYIPQDGSVPRGFISSHSIENYGWIFNKLKEGQNGYVKPRN